MSTATLATTSTPANPLTIGSRFALGLEFCGTNYHGWQLQQDGVSSVQLALQMALSKVANHPIEVIAAGRTDAGVHATQMFAHFDSHAPRTPHSWIRGTNALLPNDIAVRWVEPVSSDFHARFSATARRYQYVLYCHPHRPALLHNKVTHIYYKLNVAAMQQAANLLLGTHNFTSFRAAACQSNQPVRTLTRCELVERNEFLVLDIEANGFLHHMVRNIIGSLLMIGKEEKPISWITELIQLQDRRLAAPTADADGLYFIHASYPSALLPLAIDPISPFNLHTPWR